MFRVFSSFCMGDYLIVNFLFVDYLIANFLFVGTTLTMAVVRDTLITVANIGDSRIVLASRTADGDIIATRLSVDHKPDIPEERARICEAGGRVFAIEYDDGGLGPLRVWLSNMNMPGLAMSRSLCDEVAHVAGSPPPLLFSLDFTY